MAQVNNQIWTMLSKTLSVVTSRQKNIYAGSPSADVETYATGI